MPKISIIVPIYNVEKYIDRCLYAIQNQTLKDIEVILINDGSTDNTISIVEKYLSDKRFRLYNKKNGGLSSARNYGLKYVNENSEYVSFIDSDDYIELDMLEKMYKVAIAENSDLVECDFFWEYPDKVKIDRSTVNDKNLFVDIRVVAWNKLYKKQLIDSLKVKFTDGIRYEDVDWCYKILPYVNKFSTLREPKYHYVQRNSSIANTQNEKTRDIFIALQNIIDFYKENNIYDKYKNEIEYLVIRIILGSSFLRILGIDDVKIRNKILLENWDFLNNRFPNWKRNKILKSKKDKKNMYYKILNKKMYFLSAKMFRIIRR